MISPPDLVEKLIEFKFLIYTGVPCSFLEPLINFMGKQEAIKYIPLNNEGEALSFACGAYLAGQKPVVMIQNSGIGNMISPLTSLAYPYKIPILLMCTWRGKPGMQDEPQHELMGCITSKMLSLSHVKNEILTPDINSITSLLGRADEYMNIHKLPYAFLLEKDTFEKHSSASTFPNVYCEGFLDPYIEKGLPTLKRFDVIKLLCDKLGENIPIIVTTGKSSREVYTYRDSPNHFYIVGSMGCASSLALGVAMNLPQQKVIIIDGDGAALMRMEAFASIGYYKPKNLIHIVLDNNVHDSTGGQPSLSGRINFEKIASACGYAYATSLISSEKLQNEVELALTKDGPFFIRVRILPGSLTPLPRPSLAPFQIKDRFMEFLRRG